MSVFVEYCNVRQTFSFIMHDPGVFLYFVHRQLFSVSVTDLSKTRMSGRSVPGCCFQTVPCRVLTENSPSQAPLARALLSPAPDTQRPANDKKQIYYVRTVAVATDFDRCCCSSRGIRITKNSVRPQAALSVCNNYDWSVHLTSSLQTNINVQWN